MEPELAIARQPLGELLVARGLITGQELELALEEHRRTGRRLGEVLVGLGLISGPELELALEEQRSAELMKEGGFGTGLLSAVKRRRVRTDRSPVQNGTDEARLALVFDEPAGSADDAQGHLLFVPDYSGYDLLQHGGPVPLVGERLEVGELPYVVTKVGRSPLPQDGRPCAYLQALA